MNELPVEIGPYRLLRPIARGGMAEVYEVEERRTGEHHALKLLVQTGGALARFNREYEAMIRLNHANIVRVYTYGHLDGKPWLTMEWIDGTPIQAYAKRQGRAGSRKRTNEVVRLAHDLALALDHIHSRGLVHRDLKSANVLVLPDGRVKLLDFGTAKVSDPVEEITKEGEFIGTFAYASPEQLLNKGVTPLSDLYSFGVLLYRMVTAKMPFQSKDLRALARMHVKKPPPPFRERLPDVPLELERIIFKLLEKKPKNRFQSGREVANALEALAGKPLFLPGTLDVDRTSEQMVGREEQHAALWGFLERRAKGDDQHSGGSAGDLVLLTGPQGSGRHRVMQTLARDVQGRGWKTFNLFFQSQKDDLESVCSFLATVASTAIDGADNADTAEALRNHRRLQMELDTSAAERLILVRSVGGTLLQHHARKEKEVVVCLVHGLEHAGPVGFEALVGMREELAARGAQVLIVADCDERADDPESYARKRLPGALRVHLGPMSQREVALLTGALLHRRPPPAPIARKIWRASGGMPAYVEEVVKEMVADGILKVQGDDCNRLAWAEREEQEIAVPPMVRHRVMNRLALLSTDRRRVLEALAVAGGEASLPLIGKALKRKPTELVLAVEQLANMGWVRLRKRNGVPNLTWRQLLAEQVVLDQLNLCRRRVLERLIIEEVADDPAFVAQIRLLVRVGRFNDAGRRARDWAAHHLAKHRPVTALEALEIVQPSLDSGKLSHALQGQLSLFVVMSLMQVKPMSPQTSLSLSRARKLKHTGEIFEAELLLAQARIQRVIGHLPNFRKYLMQAWYLVEQKPASALSCTIASLMGWSTRIQGHVDDAATWHGRARRIAVNVGVPEVQALADIGVAEWQFARGLILEAERTAGSAIQILDRTGDIRGLSAALPVWASCLRFQGRYSELLEVLTSQLPRIRDSEVPTFYVRLLLSLGWCELEMGRLGRAQEHVDELVATLRRGEHLDLRLAADLLFGRIAVASGLYETALGRLKGVKEKAKNASLGSIENHANALMAEALWLLGDHGAARRLYDRAVGALKKSGNIPVLAAVVSSMARVMSERYPPKELFKLLGDWPTLQPALTVRLDEKVAEIDFKVAHNDPVQEHLDEVKELLEVITKSLAPTDAAALRLHPWTLVLRRYESQAKK